MNRTLKKSFSFITGLAVATAAVTSAVSAATPLTEAKQAINNNYAAAIGMDDNVLLIGNGAVEGDTLTVPFASEIVHVNGTGKKSNVPTIEGYTKFYGPTFTGALANLPIYREVDAPVVIVGNGAGKYTAILENANYLCDNDEPAKQIQVRYIMNDVVGYTHYSAYDAIAYKDFWHIIEDGEILKGKLTETQIREGMVLEGEVLCAELGDRTTYFTTLGEELATIQTGRHGELWGYNDATKTLLFRADDGNGLHYTYVDREGKIMLILNVPYNQNHIVGFDGTLFKYEVRTLDALKEIETRHTDFYTAVGKYDHDETETYPTKYVLDWAIVDGKLEVWDMRKPASSGRLLAIKAPETLSDDEYAYAAFEFGFFQNKIEVYQKDGSIKDYALTDEGRPKNVYSWVVSRGNYIYVTAPIGLWVYNRATGELITKDTEHSYGCPEFVSPTAVSVVLPLTTPIVEGGATVGYRNYADVHYSALTRKFSKAYDAVMPLANSDTTSFYLHQNNMFGLMNNDDKVTLVPVASRPLDYNDGYAFEFWGQYYNGDITHFYNPELEVLLPVPAGSSHTLIEPSTGKWLTERAVYLAGPASCQRFGNGYYRIITTDTTGARYGLMLVK